MAFNTPSTWAYSKRNPTVSYSDWTRPADWPAVTDVAGEVQFLVSDVSFVYAIKTAFTRPAAENIYIDWGDGVVNTITTNAATWTTHSYVDGTGIPCSRGYTTFKIRVYGEAGTVITTCYFDTNGGVVIPSGNNLVPSCGVLEAYYGNGTQTDNFNGAYHQGTRGCSFKLLEYVKMPSDLSSNGDIAYFGSSFYGCSNLAKVIMPNTMGTATVRNFDSAFRECVNLQEITLPTIIRFSVFGNIFYGCYKLTTVVLPQDPDAFISCTDFSSSFRECSNLNFSGLVNWPTALPACTGMSNTFQNCYSLQTFVFPTFGPGLNITFNSTFNGCSSLRYVSWNPQPVGFTSPTFLSVFSSCSALQRVDFPENFDCVSMQTTFQNCYNLYAVTFPSSMPSLNSLAQTFQSCINLQEVTLPTTVAASGIQMQVTFTGCSALQSITVPSGYTLISTYTPFTNCNNLVYYSGPTGPQNGITGLGSAFQNCYRLKSITLPSSLTGVTNLSSAFENCHMLEVLSLPATMNSCTNLTSAFRNCYNLRSLTLPSSMSALNTFNGTFQNDNSLTELTLPATVGGVTTFTSAFNSCRSLRTLTLPTTQMTSMTNVSMLNAFNGAHSLITINNLNRLGNTSTTGTIIPFDSCFIGTYYITTISIACRQTKFSAGGSASIMPPNKVTSVRFTNTGTGQWTGTSPQVSIAYTGMSTAAIVDLFNDLAAQGNVTTKTIDITSATGAAGLTAANRLIVTSKGWTITG